VKTDRSGHPDGARCGGVSSVARCGRGAVGGSCHPAREGKGEPPPVPGAAGVFRSPGPDGAPGAAGRREPSSGLGSPHSVSRFVYFVTLIPSYAVDFGARQTNQS
jgi:hypothetical protein